MEQGRARKTAQIILPRPPSARVPRDAPWFWLGPNRSVRLRGRVIFALVHESVTVVDLSGYPDWLLVLGGTLIAALVVWLLITVLKWTLWLLFFGLLIGGIAWAGWLLIR